jgi:hypothetical protein
MRSEWSVDSRLAESCRTEAMDLEVTVSPPLVFGVYFALVFLAQTSPSSRSLPSLPQTFASSLEIIYNCSAYGDHKASLYSKALSWENLPATSTNQSKNFRISVFLG